MSSSLRPVSADDEEFLLRVYASTRTEEMALVPWNEEQKQTFLRMQFDAQRASYQQQFPEAEYHVILHDGLPAGRLIVERSDKNILLIDIALLPVFRNLGIGSRLIEDLKAEARASERLLWVDVEFFNPAQHLYHRLGFEKIDEIGCYWRLEWRAGKEAASNA